MGTRMLCISNPADLKTLELELSKAKTFDRFKISFLWYTRPTVSVKAVEILHRYGFYNNEGSWER